jgi:hypothetical protein
VVPALHGAGPRCLVVVLPWSSWLSLVAVVGGAVTLVVVLIVIVIVVVVVIVVPIVLSFVCCYHPHRCSTPCPPCKQLLAAVGQVLGAGLPLLSPCPPPLIIVPLLFPLLLPIVKLCN